MRKAFYISLLWIAASVALPVCAEGGLADESVLLWWLQDPDIIEIDGRTDVKISELVGRGEAEGLSANAVRVVADVGGNIQWLDIGLASAEGGQGELVGGWVKTIALPDFEGDNWAGPAWANLSGLNLKDPSISFMIEIGNLTGNVWQTLAASQATSVAELVDEWGAIRSGQLAQYGELEWTGGQYAVPEPSSGILLLMGGALLALRRRRRSDGGVES